MPEKADQCWACLEILSKGAISLDGGASYHVCLKCWKQIPISKRVQIQLMARSAEDGGLGLRAFIERFMGAVDAAEDGKGPEIWPGRN